MKLPLAQGAFAPVRAGLFLVHLDIEQPLHRGVVTQLQGLPQHRAGQLRVDQRFGHGADGGEQHLEVL